MRKLLVCLFIIFFTLCSVSYAKMGCLIAGGKSNSGSCTASFGAEQATNEICTAPAGVSEADATTGWSNYNGPTFDSIDTAPSLGTYHLTCTADANTDGCYNSLPALSASTIYRISYDVRHNGTGGTWRCGIHSGVGSISVHLDDVLVTDTSYTTKKIYELYNTRQDVFNCLENSATNDGGVYIDNFSVKEATLCLGSELNTQANAAGIGSEANATTGINNINTLNSLTSTSSGTPANGTYHILADATTNPAANNGFNIDLSAVPFSLQTDHKYFIRFYIKHIGSGDTWKCGFNGSDSTAASASLSSISLTSGVTTYEEYGFDFIYSSSYKYFVCTESGTNNNGGIYIDGLSIKEIISE